MPVDTENFLRCIATLADNNNMRVGLSQTKKASAICGALTFLGGVVSGRGAVYSSKFYLKILYSQ